MPKYHSDFFAFVKVGVGESKRAQKNRALRNKKRMRRGRGFLSGLFSTKTTKKPPAYNNKKGLIRRALSWEGP